MPRGVHAILRAVHSINETAGFFGWTAIVKLSYEMGNLLGEQQSGGLAIQQQIVDTLLAATDIIRERMDHVKLADQRDRSANQPAIDSIRVQISLLNAMFNLVSVMVLGRNQLLRLLGSLSENHSRPAFGTG